MKTCTVCVLPKDDEEFSFKNKLKGIRHSQCKSCKKQIDNKYYQNNDTRKSTIRKNALLNIEKAKLFVRRVKQRMHCSKCGDKRWYVLDFHHICNKEQNISFMIRKGSSISSIKKEIRKCLILCSNCHREEHYTKGKVAEMD
jgi:hypothetical protein